MTKIVKLAFETQKYEWGKKGNCSFVAQLAQAATPCLKIEKDTPYAELWMGTHPNGPSRITNTGQSLSEYIDKNPDHLGQKSKYEFGQQLPFLFKVLSVAKALSIQAHPNKKHAEELHKSRPDLYKDPNHKPELAVALTPFEALCGFRPVDEIKQFLQTVPELIAVVGAQNVTKFLTTDEAGLSDALQDCFHGFMSQNQETITQQLRCLLIRVGSLDESSREANLAPLIERLNEQFPDDIGCFSVYFMNVLNLQPGEALYLGPNEPHAYLAGDCIECMACSDNVVRAGLTPKFKDVDTLCSMLTYKMESPQAKLFSPIKENDSTYLYAPPVKDFAVAKIKVDTNSTTETIARNSASILLVISGEGSADDLDVSKGSVYFIPAEISVNVKCKKDLLIFQAFANV